MRGLLVRAPWHGAVARRRCRRRALATRTSSAVRAPRPVHRRRWTATRSTLDPEQAEHAGLITAIAVGRGLPARAASIALATAYQESDLRQPRGRRPGLARPVPAAALPGLGQPEADPGPGLRHQRVLRRAGQGSTATRRWRSPSPRRRVQRSAFPDAYADHEDDARALASALTGNSPRGVQLPPRRASPTAASAELDDSGLTARADAVPEVPRGPVRRPAARRVRARRRHDRAHGGVGALRRAGRSTCSSGRSTRRTGSGAGRSRTTSSARPTGSTSGRSSSTTGSGRPGAAPATAGATTTRPSAAGDRAILEHRDHVHVDVHP